MLLSLEKQEENIVYQPGQRAQPPDWAFSPQPNSPAESPAHTSQVWGTHNPGHEYTSRPMRQFVSLLYSFVHPKSDSFSCSLSPSLVENVITCLLVLCLCMTAILFYITHTTGPFYLATYSIFVATMYSYPGGSYGGVRICILSSVDNAVSSTKNHQNFLMEENTGNQKRMKVSDEGRAEFLIRKKDRNVSSFREQWGPPGWRAGNRFVVWGQWDAL